jgi:hypothetical protein
MYLNLNKKKKQQNIISKSIPLEKLIKLRKRVEKLPIMENKR